MAKRRIHLTESQLYGLVEQTINELDWKTYMNAARKARDRAQDASYMGSDFRQYPYDDEVEDFDKNVERVGKFVNAAQDAYRKKHSGDFGNVQHEEGFDTYNMGGQGLHPYNREKSYTEPWDEYEHSDDETDDEYDDNTDYWYGQTYTYFPNAQNHYGVHGNDCGDWWATDLDVNSVYGENSDNNIYADDILRGRVDTDQDDADLSQVSPEFRDVYNYKHGKSKYTKGKGWNESVARRVTESVMRKLRRM